MAFSENTNTFNKAAASLVDKNRDLFTAIHKKLEALDGGHPGLEEAQFLVNEAKNLIGAAIGAHPSPQDLDSAVMERFQHNVDTAKFRYMFLGRMLTGISSMRKAYGADSVWATKLWKRACNKLDEAFAVLATPVVTVLLPPPAPVAWIVFDPPLLILYPMAPFAGFF